MVEHLPRALGMRLRIPSPALSHILHAILATLQSVISSASKKISLSDTTIKYVLTPQPKCMTPSLLQKSFNVRCATDGLQWEGRDNLRGRVREIIWGVKLLALHVADLGTILALHKVVALSAVLSKSQEKQPPKTAVCGPKTKGKRN